MDILLLFFLQAKLPAAGMPNQALGAALFFMEMGGILGAKVVLKWKKAKYRNVFAVTAALVLSGVFLEHSGICLLMTLGGFIAAFGDDTLQVRTNTILQRMFPSKQRATLISMESFTFSMIMVVLSPLAGILFSLLTPLSRKKLLLPRQKRPRFPRHTFDPVQTAWDPYEKISHKQAKTPFHPSYRKPV